MRFGHAGLRLFGPAAFGRWADSALSPHRLSRVRPEGGAPAVGEGVDEDQTSAGFGMRERVVQLREVVAPGVGDLDAQGSADDVEGDPEVPAGDPAVCGGVGREFGHEVRRRVQGQAPGTKLFGGEQPGEAGSAGRG